MSLVRVPALAEFKDRSERKSPPFVGVPVLALSLHGPAVERKPTTGLGRHFPPEFIIGVDVQIYFHMKRSVVPKIQAAGMTEISGDFHHTAHAFSLIGVLTLYVLCDQIRFMQQ